MQAVRIRQGRPDVRDRYRLAAVVDILMTGDNGIVSCQLLKRYQSAAAKVCCVDNEFNIYGSRRGFRFEGYFLSDFVSVAVLHDLPGAFIDQARFQDVAHVRRQVFIGNRVYDRNLSRSDKFLLIVRAVRVCPDFREADGFVSVQNVVVQEKLFIAVIQRGKGNYRSAGKRGGVKPVSDGYGSLLVFRLECGGCCCRLAVNDDVFTRIGVNQAPNYRVFKVLPDTGVVDFVYQSDILFG